MDRTKLRTTPSTCVREFRVHPIRGSLFAQRSLGLPSWVDSRGRTSFSFVRVSLPSCTTPSCAKSARKPSVYVLAQNRVVVAGGRLSRPSAIASITPGHTFKAPETTRSTGAPVRGSEGHIHSVTPPTTRPACVIYALVFLWWLCAFVVDETHVFLGPWSGDR